MADCTRPIGDITPAEALGCIKLPDFGLARMTMAQWGEVLTFAVLGLAVIGGGILLAYLMARLVSSTRDQIRESREPREKAALERSEGLSLSVAMALFMGLTAFVLLVGMVDQASTARPFMMDLALGSLTALGAAWFVRRGFRQWGFRQAAKQEPTASGNSENLAT